MLLLEACKRGDTDEVKELLVSRQILNYQDGSLNYRDGHDMTPLMYASRRGSIEIVRLLLATGLKLKKRMCI